VSVPWVFRSTPDAGTAPRAAADHPPGRYQYQTGARARVFDPPPQIVLPLLLPPFVLQMRCY
jgi:hypothetical protein